MPETPAPVSPNDVAKPGTTPPDATSKPVIVSRGPVAPDPMMSKNTTSTGAAAQQSGTGSMKPKLQPTTAAPELKKEAAAEEDKKHAEGVPIGDAQADQIDNQTRLGEIIESGEYKVTIKQKTSSSSAKTFFLTVLAIVIVGALVLYVLIDLNIIDAGIKLPFELFK